MFQNIANIFHAPKEVLEIIQKFEPTKEPIGVDNNTKDNLNLDENGEVNIPQDKVIGTASDIFGEQMYGDIEQTLIDTVEDIQKEHKNTNNKDEQLEKLLNTFHTNITDKLIETARNNYGSDMSKSTQQGLVRKINSTADSFVKKEYGNYRIQNNLLENKRNK